MPAPTVGQAHVDPVTGVAGDIYTAWRGAGDSGLSPTPPGSAARNMVAAQVEAIAKGILDAGVGIPPAWAVVSIGASFSASTWTHYRVSTSGGPVTVTLPIPGAGNAGATLTIKKVSGDGSAITVSTPAGSIDGAPSISFAAQYTAITLRGTGSGWDIV